MKSCSLNDFMQEISPWLSKDYIRQAFLDEKGRFVLQFLDGTQNVYEIDDCNKSQVKGIVKDLTKKGVPFKE